ncbi:MAG: hypothetical protein GX372_01260 [Ignavibacteria bacterium]|jgi:hypothetical protein|nr:hypothetical protein [Ignavibacteria bacterium]
MKELFSKKIENIHKNLMECYRDTQKYSPTITGAEREIFNRELFQKILPTTYRVGAGTIVDNIGSETGQIDAVIELPFSLSFPISSGENRVYLADTIGAAFEIKSNLNDQWNEAIAKIEEIKTLNRHRVEKEEMTLLDTLKIPAFIISYTGQKKIETIYKKLENVQPKNWPDGILIVEDGIFYGRAAGCNRVYEAENPSGSILAFISCLYKVLKKYSSNTADLDNYCEIL